MSIFVGISGGTGSGKTTIAKALVEKLGGEAVLFEMDCYYKDVSHLSKEEVLAYNFDHPDAMDFDLMKKDLASLKAGETISKPIYEFAEHRRSFSYVNFAPQPFIIVEGIFALHRELKDLYDHTIFVDVHHEIRLQRRIKRDCDERGRSEEEVINQFRNSVEPMHAVHVEPTKVFAHRVIEWLDNDETAITALVQFIKEKGK